MKPFIATIAAVCVLVAAADAQQQQQLNAAVRYWTAFALLQDPPANEGATTLLLRVAEGAAPWDEAQLGPILDANAQALAIMERASTLRSCTLCTTPSSPSSPPATPTRSAPSAAGLAGPVSVTSRPKPRPAARSPRYSPGT